MTSVPAPRPPPLGTADGWPKEAQPPGWAEALERGAAGTAPGWGPVADRAVLSVWGSGGAGGCGAVRGAAVRGTRYGRCAVRRYAVRGGARCGCGAPAGCGEPVVPSALPGRAVDAVGARSGGARAAVRGTGPAGRWRGRRGARSGRCSGAGVAGRLARESGGAGWSRPVRDRVVRGGAVRGPVDRGPRCCGTVPRAAVSLPSPAAKSSRGEGSCGSLPTRRAAGAARRVRPRRRRSCGPGRRRRGPSGRAAPGRGSRCRFRPRSSGAASAGRAVPPR